MWAEFTYDAYGLPQLHVPGAPDNTIAQAVQASIGLMLTPQLYRGYVYAAVGEMYTYYLGSRYYVPQLCRFFNSDKHSDTQTGVLATNMFAYCNNNSIMFVDPKGESIDYIAKLLNYIVKIIRSFLAFLTGDNNKDYNDFLQALGEMESGCNYSAVNKDGCLGKYQFEKIALIDCGFMNDDHSWSALANSYGVYTTEDFLASADAQEVAIRMYHKKVWNYIEAYNLDSYIGTSFYDISVTSSGLLAACHLIGVGDVKKMFQTNSIIADANGTTATFYMQEFAGYDLSDLFNSVG